MAHTDVDKVNGWTIRKLHSPDKSEVYGYVAFDTGPNGFPVHVVAHNTLTEARKACGFVFATASKPSKNGRKH